MELYTPQSHQEWGIWSWVALSPGDQQSVKCAQGGHLHCPWYHAIFEERLLQRVKCWLFHSSKREVKATNPTPAHLSRSDRHLPGTQRRCVLPGQHTSLQLRQGTITTDLHRTSCSVLPNFGLETILSMEFNLLCVCAYIYIHTHTQFLALWQIGTYALLL